MKERVDMVKQNIIQQVGEGLNKASSKNGIPLVSTDPDRWRCIRPDFVEQVIQISIASGLLSETLFVESLKRVPDKGRTYQTLLLYKETATNLKELEKSISQFDFKEVAQRIKKEVYLIEWAINIVDEESYA